MSKRFCLTFACLMLAAFSLTGCLSHWFLESETRLQVENATSAYAILSVDVLSADSTESRPWVEDVVMPGERSRVIEGDWVGTFILRFRYASASDTTTSVKMDIKTFDLDGGSEFLQIKESGDSLTYKFK